MDLSRGNHLNSVVHNRSLSQGSFGKFLGLFKHGSWMRTKNDLLAIINWAKQRSTISFRLVIRPNKLPVQGYSLEGNHRQSA